jgi:hypothetical protein
MSEFKFSCPNCGQHLVGDESWAGQRINCPACQSNVVIPNPDGAGSHGSAPVFTAQTPLPSLPRTMSPADWKRPTTQRVCGLATASLVLALLALPLTVAAVFVRLPLGLLVCVPGVICGHLALGKIRRNAALTGTVYALAGISAGYVFAASVLLGAWVMYTAPDVEDTMMAGLSLPAVTPYPGPPSVAPRSAPMPRPPFRQPQGQVSPRSSSPPTLAARPPSLPPPTRLPQTPVRPSFRPIPTYSSSQQRVDPKVTTNPQAVLIPGVPASGRLGGQNFSVTRATLQGDVLKLAQGTEMVPEFEVTIFLFGQAGSGKTLFVPSANASFTMPHVHFRWKNASGPQMGALSENYVMRLELGTPVGNFVSGRIYLELPQSYQTKLAGTFQAQRL